MLRVHSSVEMGENRQTRRNQPNLHSRLPGHGATWQDWNRYLCRWMSSQ
ncbi:hypothetical protein CAEBREN_23707 [Caenorhabditis brenneri]|uniref:Uncharacterized protein n=1 Tax=Caenorhabditis brenneri TaxID=135651 RepID=G0PIZ1_CAEBE|nr:hypothetical protein CAEBREN_23707 [Caenorhabditis brenneri]